ncbi:hypothetical protein [Streptomyces parvus]|uniref:hypothetical protein n=1 Tax=Streptomyces parvus TaxID=66428 RepID=UPI0036438064
MTTTPPPDSPVPAPVHIRSCRAADLDVLERHMPSPGRTLRNAARFDQREQGLSTFLTARADAVPVKTAQVLWQGCAAPEVQSRFLVKELDGGVPGPM